jgi:hypothetical protein
MKKVIKAIVPQSLIIIIKTSIHYLYDIRRYLKHSNTLRQSDNEKKLEGRIILNYHVIEKGLTMPSMKYNFGEEKLQKLIFILNEYFTKRFPLSNVHFQHAIKVLNEYLEVHSEADKKVPDYLVKQINNLVEETKITQATRQLQKTKDEYYQYSNASFELFTKSRNSVRDFDTNVSVDIQEIDKAIDLATHSPSACNRQPSRVYVVSSKEKIKQILSLQSGNRGFGHLSDKLLVITGELGVFHGFKERNEVYFNSGLFVMNLLNSLHYYKIAACSLNWSTTKTNDKAMRKICELPPSETVTVVIALGQVRDKFKIALSPKNKVNSLVTYL